MSFLYSILLKLFYPTSVSILLLLAAAVAWRFNREKLAKIGFWSALAVLLICGNGWVVKYSTRYLERQYPVLQDQGPEGESRKQKAESRNESRTADRTDHGLQTTDQVGGQLSVVSSPPLADCILVLGGGTVPKIPPRPTVEVAEAGNRVLYAAYLFRNGKAPKILCTAGIATGGIGPRPEAETMAELLENLGVPKTAILQERAAQNTHEHGRNLQPLLQEKGFKRVLLVTSAVHMPRAMGVFKRSCPDIEVIPAPTDFRVVDLELPWYRELVNLIPTPGSYVQFSETMHEYLGMAWYRVRGWM